MGTKVKSKARQRGGKHRRVRWHKPAGGKRRPGVFDATRAELVRGLEQRQGSLWLRICRIVIVAGYPLAKALHRVRALRSDGADSLLAMAVALLYLADVRTGFVGTPREGGGPWLRYTIRDLAQLAFHAQGKAELRRARRALDALVSLGWAFPTKQVRRCVAEDTFRSEPGVRRLNLDRICKMTGTAWLLKRDRMHADAARGAVVASLQDVRKRPSAGTAPAAAELPGSHRERPHATGDPPPGRSGPAQQIAAILERLKG